MAIFNVTITDEAHTNGFGPVRVVAPTAEAALTQAAADEMRTLEQLAEAGLTVHIVEAV